MKIGKPVKMLAPSGNRPGKYAKMWEAAAALKDGECLPLTCDSNAEASSVRQRIRKTAKDRGLRLSVSGPTIYVSKLSERA